MSLKSAVYKLNNYARANKVSAGSRSFENISYSITEIFFAVNRRLSRRLDRCDRVIQDESGDSIGGNV